VDAPKPQILDRRLPVITLLLVGGALVIALFPGVVADLRPARHFIRRNLADVHGTLDSLFNFSSGL
jgi:hypothetical protein